MKRSSRLSIALHALVHLHAQPDKSLTSAALATCLMTNPVVVRRVLGELREAGIVEASKAPMAAGVSPVRLPRSPSTRSIRPWESAS
jgi:DNA-binding IscR family transcriptional regulator